MLDKSKSPVTARYVIAQMRLINNVLGYDSGLTSLK